MIKIGLLGVGHLGNIHLKLLKQIPEFEIVGIYDADPVRAAEKSAEYEVQAWEDPIALMDAVEAVDIVTPTSTHHDLAKQAMKRFKHVFIEKPVTATVEEARKLMALAREAGVKVQVGHVERFNPAFLALRGKDIQPMFIEAHRLAQWNPRGTDVSVVLDLMIHDIDVVLSVVKFGVKKISASGVAVVSDTPDIANARIEFDNGCVANLTASRISLKNMRKMRIFQRNAYLSVDFLAKKTEILHINDADERPAPDDLMFEFQAGDQTKYLRMELPPVEAVNSIKLELEEFAEAIRTDSTPPVTLDEAVAALDCAHLIVEKINQLCIV
ncbi:MAG: Gfo/Idh/MocA family oxidoreductase [Bacteroidota bacterium]